MPFTLSPEEVASFTPAAPAAPAASAPVVAGPSPNPEPLTPEEIASFQPAPAPSGEPAGEPILKSFTVPQIVDLIKQNPKFDLISAFQDDPATANDPEVWAKVKEALFQKNQLAITDTMPVVSGLAAGDAAKTWEGVKQVGENLGGMAAGGAKWIGNAAQAGLVGPATDAIARTFNIGDEKSRQAARNETARAALETIAGTETGVSGFIHLIGEGVSSLGRLTHIGKQYKDYTEADKQSALIEAVTQHNVMKTFSTGQGPLVDSLGRTLVADLAKEGYGMRPEEVAKTAAGDPVSFVLFGAGMGGATAGAKMLGRTALDLTGQTANVANLVSKLPSAADLSRQVGGRVIQGAGKTAEGLNFAAEKTAPLAGAVAGATVAAKVPFIGELPIPGLAHGVGALQGYSLGTKAAVKLKQFGQSLRGISEAGANIATGQVTGAYEQLAKDIFEAAPGALGEAAKGAAFDVALGASQTPEEQQGLGMGMAFGLAHGMGKMGQHVLSGQIVGPRAFPGSQTVQPPNQGASPIYSQMHQASFSQLKPGQKVHVNAAQTLLSGVNPNADLFVAATGADLKTALMSADPTMSEATADLWSRQRAATTTDKNGRKIIFLTDKPTGWTEGEPSGIDAAPHEVRHAMEDVLGEDQMRQIDQEIQNTHDIDAYGRAYARKAFGIDPRVTDWRSTLVEKNMQTDAKAAAAEKYYQDSLVQYNDEARKAGNPPPSEKEVRDLVAQNLAANPIDWRTTLTPTDIADLADRYMAREIAAENFDALFKHTGTSLEPGKQIPETMARAVAGLIKAAGFNPLKGRTSEGMAYPLDPNIMKVTGAQAKGLRPTVEPSAPGARLPRGGQPVATPDDRAHEARDVATGAPDAPLPGADMSQREALGITAEAIATGTGLKLNYLSAPGEAPGVEGASPSANIYSNRETRRSLQEFYNAIDDPATRALWEKTFFPDTVTKSNKGDYLVRGYAPEVLAANAHKIAAAAFANPKLAALLPKGFELDPNTGTFTKDTWLQIYNGLQQYNRNQQAGFTGAGQPLVVPAGAKAMGAFEGPVKKGQNLAVPEDQANFFNMLYNFQRPKTGRLGNGKAPLNYMGQLVSEATQPGRVAPAPAGGPTFNDPQGKYPGVHGMPIREVNPMRAAMEAAVGGRENMPSLIEAVQVLRADRIKNAAHAPEAGPTVRSDALKLSAGFMPSENPRALKAAALQDPETGKIYEGGIHALARYSAMDAGMTMEETAKLVPGFSTNSGDFLNREEAFKRAKELGQVNPARNKPGNKKLDAFDAAFMPAEGKREIEIEGPDGRKYRAMFDGYQDLSILGKGMVPQITPLEDLPGATMARSTTYGPSLEKAGYKLPDLNEAPVAAPDVQFMHSLEGIKKMNDEEVARQKRGAEGETTRMSSHTGDEESGVVVHSAKHRSTIFVPPGEQSAKLLDTLDAATTDRQRNRILEQHYANAQFSPASSAGVKDAKQIADAKKQWKEKGTDSPYFKEWFGNSKVKDENGDPLEVYHGTTHKFDEFTDKFANPENFAGSGHYFSTDVSDARGNYGHVGGADLTSRIERRAEQLANEMPEDKVPGYGDPGYEAFQERLKAKATRELAGKTERVISAHLKLENPVIFDKTGRKGTRFEYEFDEDTGAETGTAIDLYNAIVETAPEFGVDGQKVWEAVSENGLEDLNAYDAFEAMIQSDEVLNAQDAAGNSASTQFARQVFENAGYDGIVLKDAAKEFPGMGIAPNTDHYIAFRGDQVKSTTNRGTFSKEDPRIQFLPKGRKEKPDFKLKEGLGKFSKAWITPDGTPVQLGGKWHHEWLNENPGAMKKFGVKLSSSDDSNRVDALKKGFARINYDKSSGTLTVEARQKDWPNLRESVKEFARANLGKIDNMDVHLLNDKAGPKPVESEGVRLFTYDANEKMDNLPLISAPPEVTEMSAQNQNALRSENVRFLPGGDPRAIKQAAVRDPKDGKVYEGYAHFAARQQAMQEGKLSPSDTMRLEDGFTTNTPGEFLDRTAAFKRAVELNQYKPQEVPGPTNTPDRVKQLESVRFEHQQKMKEMGYEPDVQFTPGLPGKFESKDFEKTLKAIRGGKLFGATFNTDGTQWTRGEKETPDLVSLASMNVPQGKLNQAAVDKFLAPYEDLLDEPNIKLGVYSFSKNGVPTTSIDLNAMVDQKHRANTVKFAKDNDQESIWDAVKEETVQTGGKGNTRLKTLSEINDALKPLSKGKPVDVHGIIADNAPVTEKPTQGSLFGDEAQPGAQAYDRHAEANMTKSELAARHPESVIPARRDELIPSDIVGSPLYKAAGSEPAAVKSFGKMLVDFAKEFKDHPVFKDGLKWYSDIVPKLKKQFGEHANLVAELLAATSPQNNPEQNYASTIEALEMFKAGKYDRQVKKYVEGLAMLEGDKWQEGGAKTKAAFMKQWITDHDLLPRKSNGAKFGVSSAAVLKVLAGTWLESVEGPKTYQFVRNLLGTDHGATIDVWADRTMRRLGYSGHVDRWRILPKNGTGVTDTDFAFSQKAFAHAAKEMGILPDALQGGLWFAEKQLWADRGYGNLDLGSFAKEMTKTEAIQKAIKQRLAQPVQQELLVTPRKEK